MKINAFLIMCGLIMFTSCGKDTPLQPESLKTPELVPLAKGASWEYRYYYNYQYRHEDVGFDPVVIDEKLAGKYTLTVSTQNTFQDSIIYVLNALTEPDSANGSLEQWFVRLYSDTLWYKQDQKWVYMLPTVFVASGEIDIRIFIPPIGRRYYLEMGTEFYYVNEQPDGHFYNRGYSNTQSYAIIDKNKGLYKISISWSVTSDISPRGLRKDSWLVNYTPGTP